MNNKDILQILIEINEKVKEYFHLEGEKLFYEDVEVLFKNIPEDKNEQKEYFKRYLKVIGFINNQ